MAKFAAAKATSVAEEGYSPLWANVQFMPYMGLLNIAKDGRWFDSTINNDHTDRGGNLVSLPGGVTEVAYLIAQSPVTTTDTRTGRDTDFADNYTIRWENGPTETTFSTASNVVKVADRHYTADLTLANRWVTFSGISGSDYPSNISCVRTDEVSLHDAGEYWRPDWLATLKRTDTGHVGDPLYAVLRMMDLYGTNWSDEVEWADRPTTSYQRWTRYPLEVIVNLANKLGVEGYFCFPHQATDEYVTEMATYIRDNLTKRAHYTYSNEVWNSQFQDQSDPITGQYKYVNSMGATEFSVAEGLPAGAAFYGKRLVEIAEIVDGLYGSDRTKHKIYAEWHAANTAYAEDMLVAPDWLAADPTGYRAPHTVIDAIAIAPYFGGATSSNRAIWETFAASGEAAAKTVILDTAETYLSTTVTRVTAWKAIADTYGVDLISYENSHHMEIDGNGNANLKKTVLEVTDATQYTVGEEVNNGEAGEDYAYGEVVAASGTEVEIDTVAEEDSGPFLDGQTLYNEAGTVSQTIITDERFDPKDGVLDLFEAAIFSTEMAAIVTDHIGLYNGGGAVAYNIYATSTTPNKFNMWGTYRFVSDVGNDLDAGLRTYIADNPRGWVLPALRREVDWT